MVSTSVQVRKRNEDVLAIFFHSSMLINHFVPCSLSRIYLEITTTNSLHSTLHILYLILTCSVPGWIFLLDKLVYILDPSIIKSES